jgi:hypothetical protein
MRILLVCKITLVSSSNGVEEVDWLPLEKIIKRHTTPIGASRMWLSIDNPRQSKAEDVKKGLICCDEKNK